MTDENHTAREARLAEIADRHAKATPGIWAVLDARGDIYGHWVIHPDGDAELGNWSMAERVRRRGDAEFIANSRADIPWLLAELASADKRASAPIDMILFCPTCGLQHVDEPDERTVGWVNPPHRSHLCHGCKHIRRPADIATNGVREIATKGKADSPLVSPDKRAGEMAEMLLTAANALESRSLYARGDEQFLRCGICGTPADDELGPQHKTDCFITDLRTAALNPQPTPEPK